MEQARSHRRTRAQATIGPRERTFGAGGPRTIAGSTGWVGVLRRWAKDAHRFGVLCGRLGRWAKDDRPRPRARKQRFRPNRESYSVVVGRAFVVEVGDRAAGEGRELLHDGAIDQDLQSLPTGGPVLQWPAIDDHLGQLLGVGGNRRGKGDPIAGPGRRQLGYVLNPEGHTEERVGAGHSDPIDGSMDAVVEEGRAAGRPGRTGAWSVRVGERQRAPQTALVAILPASRHGVHSSPRVASRPWCRVGVHERAARGRRWRP